MRQMRILLALTLLILPACAQTEVSAEQLASFEGKHANLTDKVIKATVGLRAGMSGGSGVIVTEDGYVLTAAHVFQRPGQSIRIILSTGKTVPAKALGRMDSDDYGLIKIEGDGPWPYVPMGSSKQLEKGQLCIAIGHPGGVQPGRTAPLRLGTILRTRGQFIRTNAIVDRGDSGGPLFDLDGRVIGIHSRIGSSTTQNMHVPVDHYRREWERLKNGDAWTDFRDVRWENKGVLGVRGGAGPGGSRLERVYSGLPAEKAKLRRGDVIIGIDGAKVDGWDDLTKMLGKKKPGDEVELEVRRRDDTFKRKVTLAAPPKRQSREDQDAAVGEMPMVKDDPVAQFVGAGNKLKKAFSPLASKAASGVVEIESDDSKSVFGTVVSKGGWIVTKASELGENPKIKLSNDESVNAKVVKTYDAYDLAFLKAESKAAELPPVSLATEKEWKWGQWLISAGPDEPIGVGVVSVLPRRLAYRGYLGVNLNELSDGVEITNVQADTAAAKAGFEKGDVIIAVDGKKIESQNGLIERISGREPGDTVTFTIRRGEETQTRTATLGMRPEDETAIERRNRQREEGDSSRRRRRGSRRSLAGSRTSSRKSGFKSVLQHDTVMNAEECGGPLIDLSGHCVGINIARVNRYATYAIPSPIVVKLLEEAQQSH